tara:strand:- start:723 stop:1241 length:519 start_codon:yes stop_codon:yes gene_type:complete
MYKQLDELQRYLIKNNFLEELTALRLMLKKADEEPDEYDEPWHQEVVEELDEQEFYNPEDTIGFTEEEIGEEDRLKDLSSFLKNRNIKILKQIGQGAYGRVYRGVYQGSPVAIKIANMTADYEVWEKIHDSMGAFSEGLKGIIPKVYDIFSGEKEGLSEEESKVIMQIMLGI